MPYYTNGNEIKLHVDTMPNIELQTLEALEPESTPEMCSSFDLSVTWNWQFTNLNEVCQNVVGST